MIIFIEGPRHSGKTFLIDEYLKQNVNPNVMYYKFKFAKYIEEFDMKDQESGPGVHYFSIGNILTILELNKTVFKDKIMIFDRSIYSAYVWSIYRNRLDRTKLISEFKKILSSELYENCALLYVTRNSSLSHDKRSKDYFGSFENYSEEEKLFGEILKETSTLSDNLDKGNTSTGFYNEFDKYSSVRFNQLIDFLIKENSKLNK